jgi:hypothetical protein
MRQALAARPSGRTPIEDEKTQNFYVLLAKEDYFRLQDDYYRRELQIAFDQVDRGEVSDLDMTAIIAEANRRNSVRTSAEKSTAEARNNNMEAIYEILDRRYCAGETDLAERHNEHQP